MLQTEVQKESAMTPTQPLPLPHRSGPSPQKRYEIRQHPVHPRLLQIDFGPNVLPDFFADVQQINVQNLEYVPFMRFHLADRLDQVVGDRFCRAIRNIVVDRCHGGFTISVQETTTKDDDYVKFATAMSHLLGPTNHDAMSGSFFARFVVRHMDKSDSYLRQAYQTLTLHTDGAFVDEPTDWLLMMKMAELHAEGGESRLLHIDDWEDLTYFSQHPLGTHCFAFKGPPSKNVAQATQRPTFYGDASGVCINYIDQFVHPETLEEARYLFDLSQSLENSPGIKTPRLPVGSLVILNNHFWMHGRAAFHQNEQLYRELMRQRGVFATDQ